MKRWKLHGQKQMPRQKLWLLQRQRQRQLLPRKLLRLRRPLLKPPPRQRRRPGRLLPLPLPRLPPAAAEEAKVAAEQRLMTAAKASPPSRSPPTPPLPAPRGAAPPPPPPPLVSTLTAVASPRGAAPAPPQSTSSEQRQKLLRKLIAARGTIAAHSSPGSRRRGVSGVGLPPPRTGSAPPLQKPSSFSAVSATPTPARATAGGRRRSSP